MPTCPLCKLNLATPEELADHKKAKHTRQIARVTRVTRVRAYGNGFDGSNALAREERQSQDQPQAH